MKQRTVSFLLDRSAADPQARTVPASLSSQDPVTCCGATEILVHSAESIDLTRATGGLPLLFAHDQAQPIGLVDGVHLEGTRLVGVLRFGESTKAAEVFADVQAGILRNVSIGYRVIDSEASATGYLVTRWQLYEASIVSVPADASVGINRSLEGASSMETQELKTREIQIREAVLIGGLKPSDAEDMIRRNISIDAARTEVMNKMAARSEAQNVTSRVAVSGADAADPSVRIRAMGEALACRFGAGIVPSDEARNYVGMRVIDMAKDLLEARGISANRMSPSEIMERAMNGTSDFPNLLLATGDRTLRAGYLSYTGGIKNASRPTTAVDFRAKHRLKLGEMPTLLKVNEGGEFKRGSTAESDETYSLGTYGRIFGITRQALINDDLGAFVTVTGQFGRAAAEFEAKFLVTLLTSNPVMADTKALFHADHGNLAGAGAVINVTTLGAAKQAMRLQKGLDGITPIDATPKYLIVPAALETVALQYLAETTPNQSSLVNPFAGQLSLIVDPRLDALSATRWYLAADPATVDGMEHAYLQGQEGPYLEQRIGFDVDGIETKCRLDFGAGFIDYRGWYSNPGA